MHKTAALLILISAPASANGAASGPAPVVAAEQAHVVVYDGWATPTSLWVSGRLLKGASAEKASNTASSAHNLAETLNALESDEITGAELAVVTGGASWAVTTDADGNFELKVNNLPRPLSQGAAPVEVSVVKPAAYAGQRGRGLLYVHPSSAATGLISDIDDTVVKTFVTDKKRMLTQLFSKNAAQLEAVSGAAQNYQAVQKMGTTAFFYVSGSPQNLYVRLQSFLQNNGFPGGPILLKNIGEDSLFSQADYKLRRIERILAAFPLMRFVLVGDSGERDPEIYLEIQKRHPAAIIAIVIRKVAGLKHLQPERCKNCTLVDDTYAADDVIARLLQPLPAATRP